MISYLDYNGLQLYDEKIKKFIVKEYSSVTDLETIKAGTLYESARIYCLENKKFYKIALDTDGSIKTNGDYYVLEEDSNDSYHVAEIPDDPEDGTVVQYVGEDTDGYIKGHIYRYIEDEGTPSKVYKSFVSDMTRIWTPDGQEFYCVSLDNTNYDLNPEELDDELNLFATRLEFEGYLSHDTVISACEDLKTSFIETNGEGPITMNLGSTLCTFNRDDQRDLMVEGTTSESKWIDVYNPEVDIDTFHVKEMPLVDETEPNTTVQYIGEDTDTFKKGHIYKLDYGTYRYAYTDDADQGVLILVSTNGLDAWKLTGDDRTAYEERIANGNYAEAWDYAQRIYRYGENLVEIAGDGSYDHALDIEAGDQTLRIILDGSTIIVKGTRRKDLDTPATKEFNDSIKWVDIYDSSETPVIEDTFNVDELPDAKDYELGYALRKDGKIYLVNGTEDKSVDAEAYQVSLYTDITAYITKDNEVYVKLDRSPDFMEPKQAFLYIFRGYGFGIADDELSITKNLDGDSKSIVATVTGENSGLSNTYDLTRKAEEDKEITVLGSKGWVELSSSSAEEDTFHVTEMPESPNEGDVVCYIGEDTAEYKKGHIYKAGIDPESKYVCFTMANEDGLIYSYGKNGQLYVNKDQSLSKVTDPNDLGLYELVYLGEDNPNVDVYYEVRDGKYYLVSLIDGTDDGSSGELTRSPEDDIDSGLEWIDVYSGSDNEDDFHVTEIPETAETNTIVQYIGESTDKYEKGHIYQYYHSDAESKSAKAYFMSQGGQQIVFYVFEDHIYTNMDESSGMFAYPESFDDLKPVEEVVGIPESMMVVTDESISISLGEDAIVFYRDESIDLKEGGLEDQWVDLTVKQVIEMPTSAEDNDVVLYVGKTSGKFITGNLYRYFAGKAGQSYSAYVNTDAGLYIYELNGKYFVHPEGAKVDNIYDLVSTDQLGISEMFSYNEGTDTVSFSAPGQAAIELNRSTADDIGTPSTEPSWENVYNVPDVEGIIKVLDKNYTDIKESDKIEGRVVLYPSTKYDSTGRYWKPGHIYKCVKSEYSFTPYVCYKSDEDFYFYVSDESFSVNGQAFTSSSRPDYFKPVDTSDLDKALTSFNSTIEIVDIPLTPYGFEPLYYNADYIVVHDNNAFRRDIKAYRYRDGDIEISKGDLYWEDLTKNIPLVNGNATLSSNRKSVPSEFTVKYQFDHLSVLKQVKQLPELSLANTGIIVQYIGQDDKIYKNGHIYKGIYTPEVKLTKYVVNSYVQDTYGKCSEIYIDEDAMHETGFTSRKEIYRLDANGELVLMRDEIVSIVITGSYVTVYWSTSPTSIRASFSRSPNVTLNNGGILLYHENSKWIDLIDNSSIQVSELPEPTKQYEGVVVQYIGDTDENYTKGRFYECKKIVTNVIYKAYSYHDSYYIYAKVGEESVGNYVYFKDTTRKPTFDASEIKNGNTFSNPDQYKITSISDTQVATSVFSNYVRDPAFDIGTFEYAWVEIEYDTDDVHVKSMPTVIKENAVKQYIGETTDEYIAGHIYKGKLGQEEVTTGKLRRQPNVYKHTSENKYVYLDYPNDEGDCYVFATEDMSLLDISHSYNLRQLRHVEGTLDVVSDTVIRIDGINYTRFTSQQPNFEGVEYANCYPLVDRVTGKTHYLYIWFVNAIDEVCFVNGSETTAKAVSLFDLDYYESTEHSVTINGNEIKNISVESTGDGFATFRLYNSSLELIEAIRLDEDESGNFDYTKPGIKQKYIPDTWEDVYSSSSNSDIEMEDTYIDFTTQAWKDLVGESPYEDGNTTKY